MLLHQGPRVSGVALAMQNARRTGIGFRIAINLLKRRHTNDRLCVGRGTCAFVTGLNVVAVQFGPAVRHGRLHQCDAANIVHAGEGRALGKAVGHFHHCTFGVSINQNVSFGIN